MATPAAAYVPFVRTGNLVFLSGHIAKKDGKPWVGQLGLTMGTEEGKAAARAGDRAETCAEPPMLVIVPLVILGPVITRGFDFTAYKRTTLMRRVLKRTGNQPPSGRSGAGDTSPSINDSVATGAADNFGPYSVVAGTKFKVVVGYGNIAAVRLALEQKEVDGVGSNGWSDIKTDFRDLLENPFFDFELDAFVPRAARRYRNIRPEEIRITLVERAERMVHEHAPAVGRRQPLASFSEQQLAQVLVSTEASRCGREQTREVAHQLLASVIVCQFVYSASPSRPFSHPRPDCLWPPKA